MVIWKFYRRRDRNQELRAAFFEAGQRHQKSPPERSSMSWESEMALLTGSSFYRLQSACIMCISGVYWSIR
jgi:hypothetical protein